MKREVVPPQTGSQDVSQPEEIEEYFKTILESGKLQTEFSSDLEKAVRQTFEERAPIVQARSLAAQEARKTYRCEGCGLEFLGILAFATHDEETGHMKNRSKQVSINAHVGHELAYRANA